MTDLAANPVDAHAPPPGAGAPLPNDYGQNYLAYRSNLSGSVAGDELTKRMMAQQVQQPAKPGETAAPNAPPNSAGSPQSGAPPTPPNATPPAAPSQGEANGGPVAAFQATPTLEAGKVGQDIGKGLTVDLARSLYTGGRRAGMNLYDRADDLSKWGMQQLGIKDAGLFHIPGMDPNEMLSDKIRQWVDKRSIADPKSVTGQLISGVAQFVFGKAMLGGGIPGLIGSPGLAFDPHSQNLANLVERFPVLKNPLTHALATDPADSNMSGIAKNTIANLIGWPLTVGLLKAARMGADALPTAEGAVEGAPKQVPENPFGILGDEKAGPAEPILRQAQPMENDLPEEGKVVPAPQGGTPIRLPGMPEGTVPSPEETAHGATGSAAQLPTDQMSDEDLVKRIDTHLSALEGGAPEQVPSSAAGRAMEPPKTYINFARIDSPTDVQRALQEVADARAAPADQARAGVMTFEDMKASAAQQNAWNILKSRREGDPLPADQMTAVRQLWLSSGAKLVNVARAAQAAPTPENLFAVRKMMEVHGWISDQVTGAITSTARSMSSMRIPVGPQEGRLQEITDRLNAVSGGADNVKRMADRIVALADSTDPNAAHALQLFIEKSVGATTRDGVIQLFRDSLLSSPVSQARILASNVSTFMWRLGERKVAEGISSALGTEGGVAPGEAAAMYNGWIGSFKDAMAYGYKAAQTGVTGEGIGDVPHEQFPSQFSSEAFNLDPAGTPGRVADFVGQAASWGFGLGGRRAIIAQHDMALTMSYGASLQANALRTAMNEVNAGELEEGGVGERIAGLLHGPDGMPDATIAAAARAEAKYGAFLDQPGNDTLGKITKGLIEMRKEVPEINMVLPFIKIPSRILSFTFERTPLAPLMSDFQAKIAQGGATRDLALGQLAVGSMITSAAADMVFNGTLKGGGPPQRGIELAQEREGERRDSIKIGNTWFNINGVHPIGKLMLLAADTAETMKYGEPQLKTDEDTNSLAAGAALSVARTLVNSSYMQGLSNLFSVIHDANYKDEEKQGDRELQSIIGSAIPQAVAATARGLDPYQRAVYSMMDELKSKIPGLSKDLPPQRDLWGAPVSAGENALARFASPSRYQNEKHEPIDDEILRLGANITGMDRNQKFGGGMGQPGASIDMSKHPNSFSRLQELAGNEYKDPVYGGLGAKDALNSIVTGQSPFSPIYNMKNDAGKTEMIRGIVNHYREGARGQLMEENPRLSNEVQQVQQQMQALRMPQ